MQTYLHMNKKGTSRNFMQHIYKAACSSVVSFVIIPSEVYEKCNISYYTGCTLAGFCEQSCLLGQCIPITLHMGMFSHAYHLRFTKNAISVTILVVHLLASVSKAVYSDNITCGYV